MVGIGNSGGDIAVEISRAAKQVRLSQGYKPAGIHTSVMLLVCFILVLNLNLRLGLSLQFYGGPVLCEWLIGVDMPSSQTLLSTRQGTWVMGRTSSRGLPVDMSVITRPVALLTAVLPRRLLSWAIEKSLNQKYDHQLYGLMPRHR